jgi:multiple sugar transport system permease protein
MVLVHLLPTVGGFILSFKRLNTFTFSRLFDAPWAGLENYRGILFDDANPLHSGFLGAVQNTAVYTLWTVGLTLGGGLAVALLLNREMRGMRLVRTLMLAPWIVPSFVVAVLWQFMWQSDVGIVNKLLVDYTHLLGERPIWLLGDKTMWAIVIPSVWRGLPFAMIFFLAGLQAIPNELHEAAAIDGASAWQRFRLITLPLMRPVSVTVLLLGLIYTFKVFDLVFVMTGGGPVDATDVLSLYVYQVFFAYFRFGQGAAAGLLLLAVPLLAAGLYVRRLRREERAGA